MFTWLKTQRRLENAFSLVEMLVVIFLLGTIGGVLTAVILNSTETTQNASASSMTQSQLLDATSRVTREISAASTFRQAGDLYVTMVTKTDGVTQAVSYFYNDKANPQTDVVLPTAIKTKLATMPSGIIEYRHDTRADSSNSTIRASAKADILRSLVTGYVPDGQPIFSYYMENGTIMTTPVMVTDLPTISRVAMGFSSYAVGRNAPMELATSVSPRDSGHIDPPECSTGVACTITGLTPPVAPILSGLLPRLSVTSTLNWSNIEGATGYTLYRLNRGSDVVVATTANGVVTYTNAALIRGETYVYTVVSNGPGGQSGRSNPVTLYAVPPAVTLSGVASGVNNTLTWNGTNGATGYRLYIVGNSTPIYTGSGTSYVDTTTYGDTTAYYVVAYNAGGDSENSNIVSLMSPPPATAVTGQDYVSHPATRDGNDFIYWNSPANTVSFQVQRDSDAVIGTTSTNYTDTSPGWASSHTYTVRACNAAGCGPAASSTALLQAPGPFALNSLTQVKRSGQTALIAGSQDGVGGIGQSAHMSWDASAGAVTYDALRSDGTLSNDTTNLDSGGGGINPGYTYVFAVVASAPGRPERRTANYYFQAAPAQVNEVNTRPQTTNGTRSRTAFWSGSAGPVQGTTAGTQRRTTVITGSFSNSTIINDGGWVGWDGSEAVSAEWNKSSATSSYWLGGMQMNRTYVNIPAGYSAHGVSQEAENPKNTGASIDGAGNVSWTSWLTFRGTGPGTWNGSYSGSWANVKPSAGNYPMAGGYDFERINAT